ncbi:MAG TPA: chemotaxis protein CheC [Polyangia bacterium]|nr:chemotaxis protein CheC [Polyangia bacterium]
MTGSLSEEKRDALQELVNLGMGSAGAALATLLEDFVELAVPRILSVGPDDLSRMVEMEPWMSRELQGVRQTFFGDLSGESVMLFDEVGYGQLAGRLGYRAPLSPSAQEEIVLDLANIVIGACVNGITGPLEEVVSFARPALMDERTKIARLMATDLVTWKQALLFSIEFRLRSCRFESRVLVLLSESSGERIDQALTRFLGGLG